MITAAMRSADCGVCYQLLVGEDADEGSERMSLACGHTFHTYCIEETKKARGVALRELKCPLCKTSAADLEGVAIDGKVGATEVRAPQEAATANQVPRLFLGQIVKVV